MHQITTPSDIPAPKFQLFQEVRSESHSGTIVGIQYVSLFVAVANGYDGYGWVYTVDFYFNAPIEKVLRCQEPTAVFDEDELEAVAVEAA